MQLRYNTINSRFDFTAKGVPSVRPGMYRDCPPTFECVSRGFVRARLCRSALGKMTVHFVPILADGSDKNYPCAFSQAYVCIALLQHTRMSQDRGLLAVPVAC